MMRMRSITRDTHGSFASAALPVVFATLGMLLLGAGAIMGILPVAFAGMGLAVIGFASHLIASAMDRQDRRRKERRKEAQAARAAYQKDTGMVPAAPRNPLADHAVAALSGEGAGGIYPPLPSQMAQGEIHVPGHAAPRAQTQDVWEPGGRVGPVGWHEEPAEDVVEFEEVPQVVTQVTPGGGIRVAAAPRSRTPVAERVAPAQTDQVETPHDFRIWPGAKDVDSWATFTGEHRPRPSRFTEEDLKKAMDERRRRIADRLPTVGAILADVSVKESELERLRREATRGKCSKCESIIWAPKKRPIVLKCPGCGHKAKLY